MKTAVCFMIGALVIFGVYTSLYMAGCSKKSVGDDDVIDDGTAPATVSDLAVAAFSDNSVTLTWTASGDDGLSGTATSYDLRMSAQTIGWGDFDSALQVTGLPAPKPSGETEQFEISGLLTDSTYFFALKVLDENGNYEGVSNCVSTTCFNDFIVNIPDDDLLAAIRDQIGKPTGGILKSDLIKMFDLLTSDRSIADLTGLEYCVNLTILNIINNSVSDLSPLIHLSKLVQLHAGNNEISDITPLAGLTDLTLLNLKLNQITDPAPLSGLTHLANLDLQENIIENISPLSGLTELAYVNLSFNRIRDIYPLVSNAGIGDGDNVILNQNPLEHESVMSYIPTLRARGATVFWVDNTYPPGAVADLKADTITAASVTLSWTAPGEDFYEGTAYQYELRYSTNHDDLQFWTGGQTVDGIPVPDTAGTIQSTVISGLTEGKTYYFALRTQDNSENWSAVSNIVWAKPYSDIVVTFSDPALEAAIRSAIAKPTGDIYKSDLMSLDSLVADNLGITDLTGLENCVNLRRLNLGDNNISQIGQLSELFGMYDLNLQGNNIADISPLASLNNLGSLLLSGNPIGNLDALSSLDKVWFLAVTFVGVADLQPLASLTNLQYLFMAGNGISDISPLGSCSNLKFLYADYNSIETITPLGGMLELSNLSLKNNSIRDISPLVSNPGLAAGDVIALENNPLSSTSIDTYIPALQARGVTVTF
jgi:internalin A